MPSSNVTSLASISHHHETSGQHPKDQYRLVVLGAAKVGKTAIIHQFLYDEFPVDYLATVEELYRGEYEFNDTCLTLDILDTSGSFQFPAMRRLAITTGDAFILVYSVDDANSFEEVRQIRDQILELRSPQVPIVVVGNKSDLDDDRVVRKEVAETVIGIDWEHGFVEASAKDNENILKIFRELMVQAKIPYDLNQSVINKRRRSLPVYPTSPSMKDKALLKRNSCAVS